MVSPVLKNTPFIVIFPALVYAACAGFALGFGYSVPALILAALGLMELWRNKPKPFSYHEAQREFARAAMRRGLYELMWERAHPPKDGESTIPCPPWSDERIKDELNEILSTKL